jgi:phosphoglycolate phosphatase-like HAD superfamily hydrolase
LRLALFDIDGTLITDGGTSRAAYRDALRSVYGYEGDLTRYDFSGRTDPQITYMVLRDAGLHDHSIAERLPHLWEQYLAGLARKVTPERVRVLPGIRPLLEALQAHGDVLLGLLTGNIEPGARLKLGAPGLNDYFRFGAFGSDSANREDLAPIAAGRAAAIGGDRFERRDIVIIGDSIYDVRCGVPHDATTIAIASGKTPAAHLRAENPHFFFESAEDLDAVLSAIVDR